jgi:hypothetical protein
MYYIGIDPGVHGAVAILDKQLNIIAVHDLPTRPQGLGGAKNSKRVCTLKFTEILKPYAVAGTAAIVEVAIVKPPMKLVASKTIGMNYGFVVAALELLGIAVHERSPSVWKRVLNLSDDKDASISLCTSLYPRDLHQFTRHDRAEAILIPRAALRNGVLL